MEQECLFNNLEEKSPKKGFDGVYKDSANEVWYVESKSGSYRSCTHKRKVKEAYEDLEEKFSNTTDNDPWLNAYNHVKMIDPHDSLLVELKELSDEYDANIPLDMSQYNISPCGTVFDEGGTTYNSTEISDEIFDYCDKKAHNKLLSICVTQRAIKEFETYLDK